MKADEYVRKYHEHLRELPKELGPDKDVRTRAAYLICFDLLFESQELVKKRRAKSGSSHAAILKEINQKYQAIVRRINDPYLAKEGFQRLVAIKFPEVGRVMGWETGD